MAKVKIHVWHGFNGEIIALGHPVKGTDSKLQVTPITGAGQGVLETEVAEELIKSLHQTHIVDMDKKVLAEHPHKRHK